MFRINSCAKKHTSFSPRSRHHHTQREICIRGICVRRDRSSHLRFDEPNLNCAQGLRRPWIRSTGGCLQSGHIDMGYVRARGAGQSALRPVRGGMQAERRPETPVAAAASTRSPPGHREVGGAMLEIGASRSSDGPCGRGRASRDCRFRGLGNRGLAPLVFCRRLCLKLKCCFVESRRV